jgi:hypothetical protein
VMKKKRIIKQLVDGVISASSCYYPLFSESVMF